MLTLDEVKKIAKLANLALSDQESAKYQPQLAEVLGYIQILNEVGTDKVSPTFQVTGLVNVFRDDVVAPSLSQTEVLKNAKETSRGYFATGRVNAGI